MLVQIADALLTAFNRGVVHMDMKANNVMIDDATLTATSETPIWYDRQRCALGRG